MRAVLFEGTPEEFAKVEATFRAGVDPTLQTRSIVLPQSRPKAWPELDEEQCHRLARRVLERAPAGLVGALAALVEAEHFSGEQTIEAWAEYADRLPEELGGTLAELARCASRAFIELFGCDNAPQRVKGAAYMLLLKTPSDEGAHFVARRGLVRAMAELDLLDPMIEPSTAAETPGASEPRPAAGASRASLPAAKPPPVVAAPPAPSRPLTVATPKPSRMPQAARPCAVLQPGPPSGILSEVARLLTPLAGGGFSAAPVGVAGAAENPPPASAGKPGRNPFLLLDWADPDP